MTATSQHFTPSNFGIKDIPNGTVTVSTSPGGAALSVTPDGGSAGTTLTCDGSGVVPAFTATVDGATVYINGGRRQYVVYSDTRTGGTGVGGNYGRVTAAGSTQVKSGAGSVHALVVGTAGGSGATVALHDSATTGGVTSGNKITQVDATAAKVEELDVKFGSGLVAVAGGTWGSGDVTVVYS